MILICDSGFNFRRSLLVAFSFMLLNGIKCVDSESGRCFRFLDLGRSLRSNISIRSLNGSEYEIEVHLAIPLHTCGIYQVRKVKHFRRAVAYANPLVPAAVEDDEGVILDCVHPCLPDVAMWYL